MTCVGKGEKPQWLEEDKNGPWIHYDWVEFQQLARAGETTPTLTKYWEELMYHLQANVPHRFEILERNMIIQDGEGYHWDEDQRYERTYRVQAPNQQSYLVRQDPDGLYNKPWWDHVTSTSTAINDTVPMHENWRYQGLPAELIEELNPKFSRRRFPKREHEMKNYERLQRRVETNYGRYERPHKFGKRVKIEDPQEEGSGSANLTNTRWW